MVEDGLPFCRHCKAPQIRVLHTVESSNESGSPTIPASLANIPQFNGWDWSQALPSAAAAGVVSALLMLLPFGVLGVGPVVGGGLAVVLYQRRVPFASITRGLGMRVGALAGAIGFGIFAIMAILATLVLRSSDELRNKMLEAVQQSAVRGGDLQAQQMVIEYLKTPQGLVVAVIAGLTLTLFFSLVFSSLGGVLAAAWVRRNRRF